ncbi:MAG: NCS2 family permease [Endomicrobium sp.]|jgi:AGZA family xanthine/uracil permease-like MFS transporter|nr:NCS2 family permease [Endomicrobium sp.]
MKDFFKLKENNTTVSTEIVAGVTTFFTMAYIIFVNPAILSLNPGMSWNSTFVATILASAVGTMIMAFFANVPFALAPGLGASAFFTFVLCKQMGFVWQEALAIVVICGFFIVLITLTKLRKTIVEAIPDFLKDSISCGIGLFIAYIGFKNASFLNFLSDAGNYVLLDNGNVISNSQTVPSLALFNNPHALLGLIGLVVMIILFVKRVKGAIFLGILISIFFGIPLGLVDGSKIKFFDFHSIISIKDISFCAFSSNGMGMLFSDINKVILTLTALFALLLSVTFDAIGTFIGAGKISGIFDTKKEAQLTCQKGFSSKFERAFFADGVASCIGGIFGTSSVTTYVESASGISAGGKTGLTSFVVAIMFLLCLPFSSLFNIVPPEATAPALIIVGVLMMSSALRIKWTDYQEAIPAFFTLSIMTFAFNISYGIAAGFIFHCIVKLAQKKVKDIPPILAGTSLLFLINFIIMAIRG